MQEPVSTCITANTKIMHKNLADAAERAIPAETTISVGVGSETDSVVMTALELIGDEAA